MSEKQNEWKEREMGALWKRVSKNGKSTFCTGYITSNELGREVKQRVVMFANKGKQTDTHPDYIIYISNEDTAPTAPKAAAPKNAKSPNIDDISANQEPAAQSVGDDDNIPL